jgi:hypothetical protein
MVLYKLTGTPRVVIVTTILFAMVLIPLWEYTAGRFQHETHLDNSTVLRSTQVDASQYILINHCRWNHLWNVLPSLVFKRSFRDYVLAHFEANDTAPLPIL